MRSKKRQTMCMDEIPAEGDDLGLLLDDASRTYVPSERRWVRLGSRPGRGERYSNWYLERSDAQALVCALLKLPLCPQGYLIQRPPSSACRQMLVGAAADLERLLMMLSLNIEHLQLADATGASLRRAMAVLHERMQLFVYNRAFASAIFELDRILTQIIYWDEQVDDDAALFVQVLALTNKELRDLMVQSLRYLQECLRSKVNVDMVAATVNFATLFGVTQKFHVNVDAVVEKPADVDRSRHIEIPYVQVLFLVLRAAAKVRSPRLR